ncbi:hypothetical protein FA95DRAFT_984357 [Auriscalpium vulgare]|uniref:Uncharacterized protein n=1 Tax=Auriscalpium vulgare TaxID=40419 RepID=A0ACB8R6J6_9AGAM|nr:hypothetical protein FA95DRAFT_984357 [Auriscalpium vulgare]
MPWKTLKTSQRICVIGEPAHTELDSSDSIANPITARPVLGSVHANPLYINFAHDWGSWARCRRPRMRVNAIAVGGQPVHAGINSDGKLVWKRMDKIQSEVPGDVWIHPPSRFLCAPHSIIPATALSTGVPGPRAAAARCLHLPKSPPHTRAEVAVSARHASASRCWP